MLDDIVYLFLGLSIIKANCSDIVMHASKERVSPLPAVLGPDTHEAPLLTLAINIRAQTQLHHTLCEGLVGTLHIGKAHPLIGAVLNLAASVPLLKLRACSKERSIWRIVCVALESLEKGSARVVSRLAVEIIVELGVDSVTDKLS